MIADIPEELEAEDDGEEFSNGIDRRAEKEEENKSEDGDYPSDFEEDEDHEEVSFLPTFFPHKFWQVFLKELRPSSMCFVPFSGLHFKLV